MNTGKHTENIRWNKHQSTTKNIFCKKDLSYNWVLWAPNHFSIDRTIVFLFCNVRYCLITGQLSGYTTHIGCFPRIEIK